MNNAVSKQTGALHPVQHSSRREWLARQIDKDGLRYRQQGNCFVWIEDYQRVQKLLGEQLQTHWTELLGSLAGHLNRLRLLCDDA